MRGSRRLLGAVLAALALAACSDDDENEFEAQMTGAKERPTPVTTAATGETVATLEGTTLTVAGNYEELTGPTVAAHIHGPADEESVAGILCPLSTMGGASGAVVGTCTLTGEQVQQLRDGLMYVNIHTQQYPQGEIRGQLE